MGGDMTEMVGGCGKQEALAFRFVNYTGKTMIVIIFVSPGAHPETSNLIQIQGEATFKMAKKIVTKQSTSSGGFLFFSWHSTHTWQESQNVDFQDRHFGLIQGMLIDKMLAGLDSGSQLELTQ